MKFVVLDIQTPRTTTSTTPYPVEVFDLNLKTARGDWLPSEVDFECGYRLNVGYIIGGEQAVRGEFPFIALLGYVDQVGAGKEHPAVQCIYVIIGDSAFHLYCRP